MSIRSNHLAAVEGYDFAYVNDPDPWRNDGWGQTLSPFSKEAEANILNALSILSQNNTIQEISVKVSDYEHYVCLRRVNERTVSVGQVRVQSGVGLWSERQVFVRDTIRRMFQDSFAIVTGEPMQGQSLPGGQLSTAERLARNDPATLLTKAQSDFLVTRRNRTHFQVQDQQR